MASLRLTADERDRLWRRLVERVEDYLETVGERRVAPELDPARIRSLLAPFDFSVPMDPVEAVDFAADELGRHQTHTPHPRYFGLFNPAPATMGIAADALVAAFNPQLAAWSHGPLAIEIEAHLVRAFSSRFGYEPAETEGTFASGGAEANHTALLTALVHAFPEYRERGTRALAGEPMIYVSAESHHSFLKAARLCGLGTEAVRVIPVDESLRMRSDALHRQVDHDRAAGDLPFLVVGTAGTTNAGIVDPLDEIAEVAVREGLWFHADAAWGGAATFVPELRPALAGIERSDSITFDAHKWLSVPMGAGLYLTRHPGALERTFRVDAQYMPREAAGLPVVDPYAATMQWSRRFTGLKVFLTLAVAGWDGYVDAIRHQTRMGEVLREKLTGAGWKVVNATPLPTVCFVDGTVSGGDAADHLEGVLRSVLASGEAWISVARLTGIGPALRATITNFLTVREDLDRLIAALEAGRRAARTA
jgi:glutamate/tyrosine decarboxylase-like PLP-dependent enzyme